MIFLAVVMIAMTCVHAADLQQAKAEGLVGEQQNGYLGIVSAQASTEVRTLIKDINSKRKAKYESIAAQNSTSLETVELLAGKKAIEKTSTGNYVQSATGWKKK